MRDQTQEGIVGKLKGSLLSLEEVSLEKFKTARIFNYINEVSGRDKVISFFEDLEGRLCFPQQK